MRKLLAALILGIILIGTASAQTADLPEPGITPDSPFYTLEKMSERLALGVAKAPVIGSEELEAKVRANQAAETLSEARAMAAKNKSENVEKLMQKYSRNMNKSAEIIGKSNNSELKNRLRNVSKNQMEALEEVERKVPEQAQKGVREAMKNSQRNQQTLEKSAGKRPENIPGSDNKPPVQGSNKKSGNTVDPNQSREQRSRETESEQQGQKDIITGKATGESEKENPDNSLGKSEDTRRPQNSKEPSKGGESQQTDDQKNNRR